MLLASNVPETDEPAWSAGTTYLNGARVMHDHGIWQSLQAGNTGNNPSADTNNSWWLRLGATNRWRAFDSRLGGKVRGGPVITYSIRLPRSLNAICFFGLGASAVAVTVTIPGGAVIYDKTYQLAERPLVSSFWDYIFSPFEFSTDLILTGLTLPSGATVSITITAGMIAEVAEIFLGTDLEIGTTLVDTALGIVDYSRKERDEWGGVFIVPRPVTKTARFRFVCDTAAAPRVQHIIHRITSKLCVFYAVEGEDPFGTTVPGILRDYELTLGTGQSFGTIDAESLT